MAKRAPVHPFLRPGRANLPWTRRRRLQVCRAEPAEAAPYQMPVRKSVADSLDSGLRRRLAVSAEASRRQRLAS